MPVITLMELSVMFSGSLSSVPVGSTDNMWGWGGGDRTGQKKTTKQNLRIFNVKHKVKGEFGSIREVQKTRTGR